MKLKLLLLAGLVLAVAQAGAEELQTFRSPMDKVNYGIGVEVIRNYKNMGVEIDLDTVIKGMKDGLSGQTVIPEKELRRIMTDFQTELRQRKARNRIESQTK